MPSPSTLMYMSAKAERERGDRYKRERDELAKALRPFTKASIGTIDCGPSDIEYARAVLSTIKD